jgi:hypothetical protein
MLYSEVLFVTRYMKHKKPTHIAGFFLLYEVRGSVAHQLVEPSTQESERIRYYYCLIKYPSYPKLQPDSGYRQLIYPLRTKIEGVK